MNKYEEAMKVYSCLEHEDTVGQFNTLDYQKARLTLQELVDKATPKKPIDRTKYEDRSNGFFEYHGETLRDIRCPNCNKRIRLVHKYKHCAKCGQVLDWSDEE